MNKLKVFLISFFLIINSPLFAYTSDPKEFVQELVTDAIEKLSDKNENSTGKILYYKKVIKPSEIDLKNHDKYLKKDLKKNFFN